VSHLRLAGPQPGVVCPGCAVPYAPACSSLAVLQVVGCGRGLRAVCCGLWARLAVHASTVVTMALALVIKEASLLGHKGAGVGGTAPWGPTMLTWA